jgi:hypothetical protein
MVCEGNEPNLPAVLPTTATNGCEGVWVERSSPKNSQLSREGVWVERTTPKNS